MDAKDSFFVFVLLLLSLGLLGSLSLTYCVWNKQTEVTSELQNRLHSEIRSEVQNELKSVFRVALNSRIHLGTNLKEASQIKGQLKRNLRSANEDTDTLSATEILTNALTEIIEMKLMSYMECNTDEYNQTNCTLRPGPKGEPGDTGPPGMRGMAGQRGERGLKGDMGSTGPKGDTGEKGDKGDIGPRGMKGVVGQRGLKGDTGPEGPKGIKGEPGDTGPPGMRGMAGQRGERGLKGDMGSTGPKGDTGEKGDKGDIGPRGMKGVVGQRGLKGDTGPEGPKGIKGEPGDKGTKGNLGYPGYKGEKGMAGSTGVGVPGIGLPGAPGAPGVPGVVGPPGPTGPQGPRGILGRAGLKGGQGQQGPTGDKGDMGERGLKGDEGHAGPKGERGQKGEPGNKGMKGNRGDPGSKGEKGEQGVGVGAPCGGPGWRRVVFLNMTNPSHVCPTGLRLTTYSRRTCGQAHSGTGRCSSTTFSVGGSQYSRVCGRALAYRWGYNHGFFGYSNIRRGLNAQYVDGLSLTHGASGSRQHIWTFASGGYTTGGNQNSYKCPCDNGNTYPSPPFVGNDYFCESVVTSQSSHRANSNALYPNALLWDGQVCEGGGTCCKLNNPPWFTKNLAHSTTDRIELRICTHNGPSSSDIALEQLELYIQ